MDIRHAILQNVKGNKQSDFQAIIVDAVSSGEEKMLPGLGVLFELFWENADETAKSQTLDTLMAAAQ